MLLFLRLFMLVLNMIFFCQLAVFAQEDGLSPQTIRADEAINSERSQIEDEQDTLSRDKSKYAQDGQSLNAYIQQVEKRLQAAERARPVVELELKQARLRFHSDRLWQQALHARGSRPYVLNTWLVSENKLRSEAPALIKRLKLCLQKDLATIEQEQYSVDVDGSSLQHDLSLKKNNGTMTEKASAEQDDRRYWANRYAPQYNPSDANAAFDNDYYNPGWGYWYQVPKASPWLPRQLYNGGR
ncbi:MAG: hypothetical protein K2W82_02370 [Candidatus Obscuribacterales bacterium]|nr:hypothetical protein [Candidatus Obscuribacterales bacterium]